MGCCMGVLRWLFNTRLNICYYSRFLARPFLNIIMLLQIILGLHMQSVSVLLYETWILHASILLQHPKNFQIGLSNAWLYLEGRKQPYTTMHVLPYPGLSDLTTYLSDNSKALYGVRSRRTTPQYTLIQTMPLSEWTNKIRPRDSSPSLHAVLHYNTCTHSLIAKSIAEGHDHLTRFFTTCFMCQFLDMGLNTPGAWVDMHSSIVTLGEWER